MPEDIIPAEIRAFIDKHIDSITELEALLLLRREADVAWRAESASERLYISLEEAENVLAKLEADGFLTVEESRYRYSSRSKQAHELVDRLAKLYSRHLIPVTRLVHSKPDRIRQFADAFKLRRES